MMERDQLYLRSTKQQYGSSGKKRRSFSSLVVRKTIRQRKASPPPPPPSSRSPKAHGRAHRRKTNGAVPGHLTTRKVIKSTEKSDALITLRFSSDDDDDTTNQEPGSSDTSSCTSTHRYRRQERLSRRPTDAFLSDDSSESDKGGNLSTSQTSRDRSWKEREKQGQNKQPKLMADETKKTLLSKRILETQSDSSNDMEHVLAGEATGNRLVTNDPHKLMIPPRNYLARGGDAHDFDDESTVSYIETQDLEVPYYQDLGLPGDGQFRIATSSDCKEPLRPGDIILYYNPVFVAGSRQGLRITQVLTTNPTQGEFPLTLCNGELIPASTKVQRIREYHRGRLYKHPGVFREIQSFRLEMASLGGKRIPQVAELVRRLWDDACATLQILPDKEILPETEEISDRHSANDDGSSDKSEMSHGIRERAKWFCAPKGNCKLTNISKSNHSTQSSNEESILNQITSVKSLPFAKKRTLLEYDSSTDDDYATDKAATSRNNHDSALKLTRRPLDSTIVMIQKQPIVEEYADSSDCDELQSKAVSAAISSKCSRLSTTIPRNTPEESNKDESCLTTSKLLRTLISDSAPCETSTDIAKSDKGKHYLVHAGGGPFRFNFGGGHETKACLVDKGRTSFDSNEPIKFGNDFMSGSSSETGSAADDRLLQYPSTSSTSCNVTKPRQRRKAINRGKPKIGHGSQSLTSHRQGSSLFCPTALETTFSQAYTVESSDEDNHNNNNNRHRNRKMQSQAPPDFTADSSISSCSTNHRKLPLDHAGRRTISRGSSRQSKCASAFSSSMTLDFSIIPRTGSRGKPVLPYH